MKKVSIVLLIFWLSLPGVRSYCQDKIYLSSDQLINDGIELHNKGEYDKALACYKKVSPSDPNYGMACYETALTFYYQDKYDEALSKCREAESIDYDKAFLYSLMGTILDDMGKREEGIELLTTALKKWPYNQNILYNLAVCYLNTDRPVQAEEILVRSILINPYHTRSHLGIAKANYQMGRLAQSYLAFNMVMLLNPSAGNISVFEEAISQKPKLKNQEYKYPYPKNFNSAKWDEIRDLLQTELSFRNDFDYDFEYNYTVGRQTLMLFRNLKYDPADTSIYNRLYVRMFSEIYQKTGFEVYLNYILKEVNKDKVAKWSEKNPDKLKTFVSWAQSFINQGRDYCFLYQNEQSAKKIYHYDEDGNLGSIGETTGKNGEVKNGPWITLGDNGSVSEKGVYKQDKAQGEWFVYWPDGTIKNRLNFRDDELEGPAQTFHPNGAVNKSYSTKSGKKQGVSEIYSHSGLLINRNTYTDDMTDGPGVYNDYSEGFVRNYTYKRDTLSGESSETWSNGKKKLQCSYLMGVLDGNYTSWYANGDMETEKLYRRDTLTGKYTEYFPNNQKSKESWYNRSGELSGKIITYDRAGRISGEENEYVNGRLNGTKTEFFPDGRNQRILTYRDDHLINILCFDDKGKQIYNEKSGDSSIYFKSFYPDGILRAEGLILNDKRHGKWMFYNPIGLKTDESNYSNGQSDGPQRTFYANGQVEKEYTCYGNYILGEYREYYINGHLRMQGSYDSTGNAGLWLYYYPNDTVSSIVFYKSGKSVGRLSSFYPTGKLRMEEFFNNEGSSVRTRNFEDDGSVSADLNYKYGNHTFEINFPNGKLKEKKNITDNVLNGLHETYYPNGNKASQIEYSYGSINGWFRKWDYAGNLTYEIPYVFNKAEGDSKWYKNNILEFTAHYELDKSQGKTTGYYYNGKKAREYTYVDDKKEGSADYYSPEGILMYRLIYSDNTIKAYSYADKTGKMVPEIPVTDTLGRIVAYYPNGKVSASISLSHGLYNGKFTTYYSTGSLLREEIFQAGLNHGYDKSYYPDGKLRELINFSYDNRHGLYELYYENGKKEMSGNYFMDNETGDWTNFTREGGIKAKLKYKNGIVYEITRN